MKEKVKKINKQDKYFLVALGIFALCNIFRFFDQGILFHPSRYEILQNYTFNKIAIIIYFISLFCMYSVVIILSHKENKKDSYYLISFISTFLFPMFLSIEYFGTMDMYAWIFTVFQLIILLIDKFEWICILLNIVMIYICPMSIFSCECIVLALLLYKVLSKKNVRCFYIALINFVFSSIYFLNSYFERTLLIDAHYKLNLKQFILLLIILIPYIILGIKFFSSLLKETGIYKRLSYLIIILGVLPSILTDIYLNDYARAFFHVFTYYLSVILILNVLGENEIYQQLKLLKCNIKEWIPIPVLIIVVPFLFMALWISGYEELLTEVFVGI